MVLVLYLCSLATSLIGIRMSLAQKHLFHLLPSPLGMTLPRPSWIKLNRLRTGVGTVPLNNAQMGLGALRKLQLRSRGANGRSHTSFLSPVPPSNGTLGLAALNDDIADWLQTTAFSICRLNEAQKHNALNKTFLTVVGWLSVFCGSGPSLTIMHLSDFQPDILVLLVTCLYSKNKIKRQAKLTGHKTACRR